MFEHPYGVLSWHGNIIDKTGPKKSYMTACVAVETRWALKEKFNLNKVLLWGNRNFRWLSIVSNYCNYIIGRSFRILGK